MDNACVGSIPGLATKKCLAVVAAVFVVVVVDVVNLDLLQRDLTVDTSNATVVTHPSSVGLSRFSLGLLTPVEAS